MKTVFPQGCTPFKKGDFEGLTTLSSS